MISLDRIYELTLEEVQEEYKKLYAGYEKLKRTLNEYANCINKGDAIINKVMNMRLEQHESIINRYKQALDKIKDICCAKTKNCHIGCLICSTKCNENKILDIINQAKEVNNER